MGHTSAFVVAQCAVEEVWLDYLCLDAFISQIKAVGLDACILCLYFSLGTMFCIDDICLSGDVTQIKLLIAELFPQHEDQVEMLLDDAL